MKTKTDVLLLTLLVLAAAPSGAQMVLPDEELDEAIIALSTQATIEKQLLEDDRQRYLQHIRLRRQANLSLDRLYSQLDTAYGKLLAGDISADEAQALQAQLDEIEGDIQTAEAQARQLLEEGWRLRERLRERGMRLSLLAMHVDEMRGRLPSRGETVNGTWQARLLPMDVAGTFYLRQRGTLLEGQYQMQGGRHGSFTGTVIGDHVTLQQIDASYGKDSTFYGMLKDGNERIEGTWESINLSGGRPGFGTWSAVRTREQPAPSASSEGQAEGQPEGQ